MTQQHRKRETGVITGLRALLEHNRLGELLVKKGRLSQTALNQALFLQTEKKQHLGNILIAARMVSRRTLYTTLLQQWSLRGIAAMAAIIISLSGVGVKSARAGSIKDIPHELHLANTANTAFSPVKAYPALFGSDERSSSNISAFTKWSDMFDRFDRSMRDSRNSQVIRDWEKEISAYQGLPLPDMVQKINALVNQQRYIIDIRNWGKSDYWETPIEFLTRGGDCEDFAIAKYVALRALGVPEERLRIAIVHDLEKDIPHALLIVYTDNGAMILDNQAKRALPAQTVSRYRPIFSINRTAWWLHTAPSATVVASR